MFERFRKKELGNSELREPASEPLSIEQRIQLARELVDAVNTRNQFTEERGGFDTFAEVWQHVEGNREEYDKLESEVTQLRKELDEKVVDKKALIKELRRLGEKDVADRIAAMFRLL